MSHPSDRHLRFEVRRIVGLPSRRELPDETRTYPLELHVGQVNEATLATLTLDVSTPAAFEIPPTPQVLSDRARLVVRELDGERIRQYLTSLVRSCTEPTLHAALPVFSRYFVDAAEPPTPSASGQRRSGAVELRGFDPAWEQPTSSESFHLTFGVALRHETIDTELAVAVVTPAALRARAQGDAFVLSHRATIVVSELDWPTVQAHLRHLVERRCAAPTLEHAVALLQRYFRIPWETSTSRTRPSMEEDFQGEQK